MLPRAVHETLPVAKAKQVTSDLSLAHPCDMDLRDVAFLRGALVTEAPISGADGWLVKVGETGVIRVRDDVKGEGQRRFIIAHEIGHFELHFDSDQLDLCTGKDLHHEYDRVRPEEREASLFATELLLPEILLREKCEAQAPNFEFLSGLARDFKTSVTMTAMRYIQFSGHRAALVVSEKGRVKWYRRTEEFGYYINTRVDVDKQTFAADFFNHGKCPKKPEKVEASAWIKNPRVDSRAFMWEQCFPMPWYDAVLSLVWIEDDIERE